MKAVPEQRALLLDLQAIDTELSRLRRATAQRQQTNQVKELEAQRDDVQRAAVEAEIAESDLKRGIDRAETEIERVRARLARDREMANSGASAKVQRELEHELGSLERRLTELEDAELEMLAEQERIAARLVRLQERAGEIAGLVSDARVDYEAVADDSRSKTGRLTEQRSALTARLDPALVERYERIRRDTPVAAAQLVGTQCGGCRLELPPGDLDALRSAPEDEIRYCEECGCILLP